MCNKKSNELHYTMLKNVISPLDLGFNNTDSVDEINGIIGQERAEKALDFGLNVKMRGYNIYVSGYSGTGRTTYAKECAEKIAFNESTPSDWCYVYNFDKPKCPQAICLKPGDGRKFKDDMLELIELLNVEIPKAFSTEDYEKQKNNIVKVYQNKRDELMKDVSDKAKEEEFGVKTTNSGVYFLPIIDGEIISEDEYDDLEDNQKEIIIKKSDTIQEKAAEVMRNIKEFEKSTKKEIEDLEYKVGLSAVKSHITEMQENYCNYEEIVNYLNNVQKDILENIDSFFEEDSDDDEALSSLLPWLTKKTENDIISKYKVNLFVDNGDLVGAPVIVDYNPSYYNLAGEVEYDNEFGNLITDFMKIKPGLLHKANGGYLIVRAHDILTNPQAWEVLIRVLKTGEISIENMREQLGGAAVSTLKPQTIKYSGKIIMIGSAYYYELLNAFDDMFDKYFKVLADFDTEMVNTKENIMKVCSFIKSFTVREKTAPFDCDAVSKIIEYSTRISERQDKLTTVFSLIHDLLCESATWAALENAPVITAFYIKKALYEKQQRINMYEEKINEMLDNDYIILQTTGAKIGQINGLAVMDVGEHTFAKPTLITATTYMGESGIINIEKEAEMSGQIHDKGVQVLTGFLGHTYAKDFPLTLSARICFEQNYNGIDGDSASSTELYAVLSSLAEIPITQEIAVTGSINQWGEIQAIGGVTYKIEGFFDLCNKRGLTGGQGVIIPCQNVKDLVLKDEVVEAVKKGKFHIYPISNINEGIEILMNTEAGEIKKDGRFPKNSVHGKVYAKLKDFYNSSNRDSFKSSRKK